MNLDASSIRLIRVLAITVAVIAVAKTARSLS
jgi:hypothetical protein